MTDEQPKYQKIAGDLRQAILSGVYPPGTRLPTKAKLVELYKRQFETVSSHTLDGALNELRKDGLILGKRGLAIFVADPLPDLAAPSEEDQLRAMLEEIRAEFRAAIAEIHRRLDAAGVP